MTAIYKATASTPYREFQVAVDSTEYDASSDIFSAVLSQFNFSAGMLRVKNISKSNRRIIASMEPVKNTRTNDGYWAWIKKIL